MIPWYVFALLSAFLAAASVIFRKEGLKKVHALEFSTTRTFVCALCGLCILPFFINDYSLIEVGIIYIVSLLITAGIRFYSRSLRHMEISTAVPLFNLTPAFLVLWAYIFLGESLTKIHLLGVFLLIFGTYVLQVRRHYYLKPFKELLKTKYFHYIIFGVVFFSFVALLDKVVLTYYSTPMRFLALVWVFVSINFLIIHTFKYDGWYGVVHTFKTTKMVVILAGVFAFLSSLFYFQAASIAFIALVVPVKKTSSLLSTVIGGELFHDHCLLKRVIACIIMIIGAILVILA